MLTSSTLIGVFVVLWLYFLWSRRRFYSLYMKMRGPAGLPLLGLAYQLRSPEVTLPVFYKNNKKYGRAFVSWMGPLPFLVIAEPELTEIILTSPDFVNKALPYDAIGLAAANGLFNIKNPLWNTHRKLINPTFSHKVLLSFIPIFNKEVKSLSIKLDELVGAGAVDLTFILQSFSLNVASQTTMGKKMSKQDDHHSENLVMDMRRVQETLTNLIFAPWLCNKYLFRLVKNFGEYMKSRDRIQNFVQKLILEKISESESRHEVSPNTDDEVDIKKNPNIFIDRAVQLMKSGEFTWEEVECESNVIVFGAFETTANTIGNVLMILAMFPHFQERLFEEVSSILPSNDADVTYEDTQEMSYMEMVLNETMRVLAPVPLVGREAMTDFTLPNGVVLPKGLQVLIDIFHMQRDTKYWGPEATTFNPDHFLAANMADKHPYSFIPFVKGIRTCIGQRYALLSIKIILAKLVRKYRFTTKSLFKDLEFVDQITLKFKKVPLIEVHLRETYLNNNTNT